MLMFLMSFLSWWYGPGWVREIGRVKSQLAGTADTFSIGLLFMTLFSPFRQISAGRTDGPLGVMMRAWLDRLISRFIGAMVRSFMIVLGVASLLLFSAMGGVRIGVWPVLPTVPVLLILLGSFGWMPW